mgnify:CR=1 FL=1
MSTTKRPPIIAVMGHVDHGKSTLLDYIRKSNVVDSESGGITQHVSAYEVEHTSSEGSKEKITFLDTPGHEAFSAIRTRSASVADIAILVVAADDGVKPQTLEALGSIKKSGIPFIVAINKIDKPGTDIEHTKANLAEHDIFVEGYGGDIPFTPISAIEGTGVSDLLDTILLVAEMEELTGDSELPAEGFVIESKLDAQKGVTATLLIKNGTLKKGQFVISGNSYCPVRFIENFQGIQIETGSLSEPVLITGWSSLPSAGESFRITSTKQEAEEQAIKAEQTIRPETKPEDKDKKIVPLVLKSDTFGTLDAVIQEIQKISLERIAPKIIAAGIGPITEKDVQLAGTKENSLVIGFNTKEETRAKHLAERDAIHIETFSIIYKLTEWLEEELTRQTPLIETDEVLGSAKILKTFSKTKDKQVLGGRLLEGTLRKGAQVKILRRDNEIGRGDIKELQQQKSNVTEVSGDIEFGMMIESKIEIVQGDTIQSFERVKK